jgi:hypothetical protein
MIMPGCCALNRPARRAWTAAMARFDAITCSELETFWIIPVCYPAVNESSRTCGANRQMSKSANQPIGKRLHCTAQVQVSAKQQTPALHRAAGASVGKHLPHSHFGPPGCRRGSANAPAGVIRVFRVSRIHETCEGIMSMSGKCGVAQDVPVGEPLRRFLVTFARVTERLHVV